MGIKIIRISLRTNKQHQKILKAIKNNRLKSSSVTNNKNKMNKIGVIVSKMRRIKQANEDYDKYLISIG